MRTRLRALVDRIAYYEWAYGCLAEADSEIGAVAEYLVGKILNCLPPKRKVKSLHDLEMADGTTIEVKASSSPSAEKGRPVQYLWKINSQASSLRGKRELSQLWLFMIAAFPNSASSSRAFDVFDLKYWSVYPVPASALLASGVRVKVKESTLRKLGIAPIPLADPRKKLPDILT